MNDIAILRTGTLGIALARMLSNAGHSVTVWSAIESELDQLQKTHVHKNLPNTEIPEVIIFI